MQRVDVYIKVELELDEEEKPERVATEICRQIQKNYVVRRAEVTNSITHE
jgi:phosphoribosylformylglycinamidine (FGAM) synthase PurS component